MRDINEAIEKNINFEMQVLELRKNEYTVTEISSILHVSSEKVSNAIKSLTEKGLLATKYKNLHGKSMLKRKQRALELLEDGKTVKEIAHELEVSIDTVYKYIKEFIKDGKVTKEVLNRNADLELESRVLELRNSGYTKPQIMEELDLGNLSVTTIIQKLVENGQLKHTNLNPTPEETGKEAYIKNEIEKLIKSGCALCEVARTLKIGISMAYNYTKDLISEGKLDESSVMFEKQYGLHDLEQMLIEMMENRISRVQMARESKMSYNKIGPIINRLIKDNRIKENENTRNPNLFSRKLKKEIDMRNKEGIIHDCREEMSKYERNIRRNIISEAIQQKYASCCKKIVECGGNLTREEVDILAETIAYGDGKFSPENLLFISNEYRKLGEYAVARRLCATCEQIYGKNELISEISVTLKVAMEKQQAYNLLKNGKTNEEIMNATNLRQTDIIRMRREYGDSRKTEVAVEPEV